MIRVAMGLVFGTLLCSGWVIPPEPEGKTWTSYGAWSDCTSFCARASTQCNTPNVGDGVLCLMECDVAAQFEGREITDPNVIAIREQLICVHEAEDCDAVHACLTP